MAAPFAHPFGITSGRSERGIPIATFIEDVPSFLKQPGADTKTVMEALDGLYRELKDFESRLTKNKETHKATAPEIKETIEVVEFLKKKTEAGEEEATMTNFQVSASVFAEAKVDHSGKVVLWLGASTAAELTYDEALELLSKNLARKDDLLRQCEEDIKLTKTQITTTEVSLARVYNNDVKERRSKAAEGDGEEEER